MHEKVYCFFLLLLPPCLAQWLLSFVKMYEQYIRKIALSLTVFISAFSTQTNYVIMHTESIIHILWLSPLYALLYASERQLKIIRVAFNLDVQYQLQ